MQIAQDVLNTLKSPFTQDLDLMHVALIIGVVILAIVVWVFILRHVQLAGLEA